MGHSAMSRAFPDANWKEKDKLSNRESDRMKKFPELMAEWVAHGHMPEKMTDEWADKNGGN